MRSKYEIRCEQELQQNGWFTDFKVRPTRVRAGTPVDYWHIFDLLAWKPNKLKFISVKGISCPAQHKKDLATFTVPDGVSVELWKYKKDKNKITRKVTKYGKK